MKTFYIANDEFDVISHTGHTLKSLCHGNPDPVVLITKVQSEKFRNSLPANCEMIETLPSVDDGRNVSPPSLGAQIAEILLRKNISEGDLVVLKMPFPYLLLAVTYALALSKVSRVRPRLTVLISQTDDGYITEMVHYSHCFSIIEKLPKSFRESVVLLHEREVLRQFWQEKFPSLIMGCCGYVTEWFRPKGSSKSSEKSLAYLGEARAEKGFLTLAKAVDTGFLNCSVVVHCDANPANEDENYFRALELFKSEKKSRKNVSLINQRINNCFDDAFHPGSIALMLYSPEYQMRGSGILQECAAAGMYVIAYDDLRFHLDFPQNVVTVARTDDIVLLAKSIQNAMERILSIDSHELKPQILTAIDFRNQLTELHKNTDSDFESNFVFVLTNNVHNEGCSKIIESQEDEIQVNGLTPVYISFEWPDLSIQWTQKVAFDRVWKMQMNAESGSYGFHMLTICLVTKSRVLESYNSFQYKELTEISTDVENDLLDTYLSWRINPKLVMNYLHHAPILKTKLKSFETTFLEMHDISSVQQQIRNNDNDNAVFEANLALELKDLKKFRYKYSLSKYEAAFLEKRGVSVGVHSYLDVIVRNAVPMAREIGRSNIVKDTLGNEYLCIVGSGHPSNVVGINAFCEYERHNSGRKLPIAICGKVCEKIKFKDLEKSGIYLFGFIEDIEPIIADSLATLNPVDVGSGAPIKVFESIAYGAPCFVTQRTISAMASHPLVIEYNFADRLLCDIEIQTIAQRARNAHQRLVETALTKTNKLGDFLSAHRSH